MPTTRIPAIEVMSDEMVHALRGKTGAERLQIASDLYLSARRMSVSHRRDIWKAIQSTSRRP